MSEIAAAPETAMAAGSPLAPRALRDLFVAPRRFFSRGRDVLTQRPEVTFVAWIVGVAGAIDRLDWNLSRESGGPLMRGMTESWIAFWFGALAFGIVGGWLRWHVLGWLYRLRLKWCGDGDPDEQLARSVNAFQTFVVSLPSVLWVVVATFVAPDYGAAYHGAGAWAFIPIAFLFWSCITSYVGATTAFPRIRRGRAALWFLALPLFFATVVMIVAAS